MKINNMKQIRYSLWNSKGIDGESIFFLNIEMNVFKTCVIVFT